MIVAVCLNPAVDVTYAVPDHAVGQSHRVTDVRRRAGGKGVNVARTAHQLGARVLATGLAGGATGAMIANDLANAGVPARFLPVAGATRQTVTVVAGASATTFNEPGPQVSAAEWEAFTSAFAAMTRTATVVTMSGSLPPGVPVSAYAELTTVAHEAGAAVLVDADGAALRQALPSRPDVVKPNAVEAGELLGHAVATPRDGLDAARRAVELGAGAAVVSLGPDGCAAVIGARAYLARPPYGVTGNPTGAGDALVAAVACGLARGEQWSELLASAVAVSAAAVAVPIAGGFDTELAAQLRPGVVVEEVGCRSSTPQS